ncbi:Serine/threonine-protein kinase TOR [Linum grandiflorum]
MLVVMVHRLFSVFVLKRNHGMRILQRWDDALGAYTVKASQASSLHLVLEATLGTLDEHMHLLFPALIRLFKVDAPVDIRRAAIKTLTRLIPRVQVTGYISSLVHHLKLVLDGCNFSYEPSINRKNDELRKDVVDALCCLANALGGGGFHHFYPITSQVIIEASTTASQKQLVRSLEMAFSAPNVPPEILATLLNLAEFMEHDEKPLPIDIRLLGALADKALHYKEMVFEGARTKKMDANLVAVVEDLIHINNQLHQHEAAVGILTYAQQHLGVQLKESWMRCLAALARWEELNNLCKEYWTPAEPSARLEMAPALMLHGTWESGIRWQNMCLDCMMAMKLLVEMEAVVVHSLGQCFWSGGGSMMKLVNVLREQGSAWQQSLLHWSVSPFSGVTSSYFKLDRQIPAMTTLDLKARKSLFKFCSSSKSASPDLVECRDLELAVPGTCHCDGKGYAFLLKGHEDLCQDECMIQWENPAHEASMNRA